MRPAHRLPLTLLAAWLVAGCTITPGMRNDLDSGGAAGVAVTVITPAVVLSENLALVATADEAAAALPTEAPANYLLGPGDVLQVVVWDHPELTNPSGQAQADATTSGRLVEVDGSVYFPYVGSIQSAGLTTSELRERLSRALSRFIRDPQVDVRVAAYRSKRMYVTGEVVKPGVFFLDDTGSSVLDVIAGSGGFSPLANRNQLRLTREGKTTDIDLGSLYSTGNVAANLRLRAGDVLHVRDVSEDKIFLLGEFAQQKTIVQDRGRLSLADALTQGGGLDKLGASASAIFIFRRDTAAATDEKTLMPKVFALDLTRAESLLLAERFPLQPRDVVYIAATDFAKYNRTINQLLPTISAVFQLDRLVRAQ